MKTANFKSALVLSTAIAAAVLTSACAFHGANVQSDAQASAQTVTIAAKRMSADEKIAYDTQDGQVQTVVIAGKLLTADEKIAYDTQDSPVQTVVIASKHLTAEQKLAMAQQDTVVAAATHAHTQG